MFHFTQEQRNLIVAYLLDSIKSRHSVIEMYDVAEWERRPLFIDIKNEINDQHEEIGGWILFKVRFYLSMPGLNLILRYTLRNLICQVYHPCYAMDTR